MSPLKPLLPTSFLVTLGALSFTLICRWIFNNYPELTENLYYKGIYSSFRSVWDFGFGHSPIPLFYVWLIVIFILFMFFLRTFFLKKGMRLQSLNYLLILLIVHYIWFYWSWGFNYGRITLGQRWQINSSVTDDHFLKEFFYQTKVVDSLRQVDKNDIENSSINALELENEIRKLVNDFQYENSFLVFDHVRCRDLSLQGILLIWSTSGVYLPFIGESQLDGGLHKLSKPFTMAHELCHGMGWTHEGDCNFMAYLICRKSSNPFIKYSGELNYWRYLYANASRTQPDQFKIVRSSLNTDVLNDLKEINAANDRYPELFPTLRNWFYDWYLKNNGIASGDKSYSEIIRLVINYKQLKNERMKEWKNGRMKE